MGFSGQIWIQSISLGSATLVVTLKNAKNVVLLALLEGGGAEGPTEEAGRDDLAVAHRPVGRFVVYSHLNRCSSSLVKVGLNRYIRRGEIILDGGGGILENKLLLLKG